MTWRLGSCKERPAQGSPLVLLLVLLASLQPSAAAAAGPQTYTGV